LLFTRTLTPGTGLVGEIRRNLALYAGQPQVTSTRDRVQSLLVAGNGEHNLIREQLQELLAIPVNPLDPFAGVQRLDLADNRGGFAGAMGLLHLRAAGVLPINFSQPKEPRPERDPNQKRYLMIAAASLFLVVAALVFCGRILADRAAEITFLQNQI